MFVCVCERERGSVEIVRKRYRWRNIMEGQKEIRRKSARQRERERKKYKQKERHKKARHRDKGRQKDRQSVG